MKKQTNSRKPWTFRECLDNEETKSLIEQIEWGCSDTRVIDRLKNELFRISGHRYQD